MKPEYRPSMARTRHARKSLPWFGRGGCDRALISLAANGPLTVRELARATKTDAHKMWDIIERLRSRGVVVKRDVPGGRKYVSLNRGLATYRPLMRLLHALDRLWPATRCTRYVARWRMPFDSELTDERLDQLFQSPVRSRTLLFVAAVGETDLTHIYTMLGLNTNSVWLAVKHWQKQGILRSRRFKTHRLISLDPTFIVAAELRALLRAVIANTQEYYEFRHAARRTLRPILKAVGATHQTRRRASDTRR